MRGRKHRVDHELLELLASLGIYPVDRSQIYPVDRSQHEPTPEELASVARVMARIRALEAAKSTRGLWPGPRARRRRAHRR